MPGAATFPATRLTGPEPSPTGMYQPEHARAVSVAATACIKYQVARQAEELLMPWWRRLLIGAMNGAEAAGRRLHYRNTNPAVRVERPEVK